jgi:hypothetical protein
MKNLIIVLTFFMGGLSFAQQSVSFQATKYTTDIDSDEYTATNEVFTFSFKDKILCHNVFTGVEISDSQFYKLTSIKTVDLDAGDAWRIEAESGVSGSTYVYVLVELADNGGYILIQGDYWYVGNVVNCKTFKQ